MHIKTTGPRADLIANRHNISSAGRSDTDDLTVATGSTRAECEANGGCPGGVLFDHIDDVRPGEVEIDETEFISEVRTIAIHNFENVLIPGFETNKAAAEQLLTDAEEDLAEAAADAATPRWLKRVGQRHAEEERAIATRDIETASASLEHAQAEVAKLKATV